jgi:hypothetical protein
MATGATADTLLKYDLHEPKIRPISIVDDAEQADACHGCWLFSNFDRVLAQSPPQMRPSWQPEVRGARAGHAFAAGVEISSPPLTIIFDLS